MNKGAVGQTQCKAGIHGNRTVQEKGGHFLLSIRRINAAGDFTQLSQELLEENGRQYIE